MPLYVNRHLSPSSSTSLFSLTTTSSRTHTSPNAALGYNTHKHFAFQNSLGSLDPDSVADLARSAGFTEAARTSGWPAGRAISIDGHPVVGPINHLTATAEEAAAADGDRVGADRDGQ